MAELVDDPAVVTKNCAILKSLKSEGVVGRKLLIHHVEWEQTFAEEDSDMEEMPPVTTRSVALAKGNRAVL